MTDNTLVIFTSDNGCSKAAGIKELAAQGHLVSAHLRGSKADIWDGGHRIPFIVRWPGKVEPGSTQRSVDLLDRFVRHRRRDQRPAIHRRTAVKTALVSCRPSPASRSSRPAAGVIHHSVSGHFAYRTGNWKLILARGSGGWSSPKENEVAADAPKAQLYDLNADPGEKDNLYEQKPELAKQLLRQLSKDITSGRSTAGPKSNNDVDEILLWKSEGKQKRAERKKAKKGA